MAADTPVYLIDKDVKYRARTDHQGIFRIPNMVAGEYSLVAGKGGYAESDELGLGEGFVTFGVNVLPFQPAQNLFSDASAVSLQVPQIQIAAALVDLRDAQYLLRLMTPPSQPDEPQDSPQFLPGGGGPGFGGGPLGGGFGGGGGFPGTGFDLADLLLPLVGGGIAAAALDDDDDRIPPTELPPDDPSIPPPVVSPAIP